jgi:hypothetical protein
VERVHGALRGVVAPLHEAREPHPGIGVYSSEVALNPPAILKVQLEAIELHLAKAHPGRQRGSLWNPRISPLSHSVSCAPSMQPPQRMHIASCYEAVLWL